MTLFLIKSLFHFTTTHKLVLLDNLFFDRLRKTDLNIKFVTNTTKESQRLLLERLRKIGFDIQPSEIFTSLTAAVKLIKKNSLRPFLIVDDRALDDFEGK